jgi:hypothetical protein
MEVAAMDRRLISVDEHAALRELEARGPSRHLAARVSGRLALYGMIDEGPRGWDITALGRAMVRSGRVAPRTSRDHVLSPVLATANNVTWSEVEEADDGEADPSGS